MEALKKPWHYVLIEPLTWIFYAFFQPARFEREYRQGRFVQRIIMMLRLALPVFLVSYPLILVVNALFLPFHVTHITGLTQLLTNPLEGTAIGTVIGTVIGIVSGITGGIMGCIVVGIAGGIVGGTEGGIVSVIAIGIVGDGTARGAAVSIAVVIVGGVGFAMGYFRLPLYLCSCFSGVKNYVASRNSPQRVFTCLHHCSLYWDELVYLPIPFLKRILLIAMDEDVEKALEEVAFIVAERPQQMRAARTTALEIAMRELEMRRSLSEIAELPERLVEILPLETKLIDPRWVMPLSRLRDICQDAARSCSPIGLKAKQDALEAMKKNMRKVHPHIAFKDQGMNSRLEKVMENWSLVVQQEQERLKRAPEVIDKLDNPYKPGNVLQIGDPRFVGRLDLALQLEKALSQENGRPTFLLFGERRMGKSTTLIQLPRLLGSRYLPVFCDLQEPGVSSNIATFLGTLATRIQQTMIARGLKVGQIKNEKLEDASRKNEPEVYAVFNRWLEREVEEILTQQDRILLLTFDEIEHLDEIRRATLLDLNFLLNWFRNRIQYHPQLALLFSSVHTIDELGETTGINWSSYFVNVRTLHVGLLQPAEARQLITRPIPDFPGTDIFADEVVQCIISQTACHPFLVQAVCSMLIDNLNTTQREHTSINDVEQAIKQVLDEWWSSYFLDLWRRTDEEQRACLSALQTLAQADLPAIARHTGLDERTARRAMRLLVRRDLVVLSNTDATYTIAAPIFRDWVERGLDL